jgi:glyoxylase-like metal-dependent hydrolase (beta-lactamase superfamily II)
VDPRDVTDVLFTHLHRDHVGWASIDDDPIFPRATLRCGERDYSYFVTDGRGDPEIGARLQCVRNRIEPFEGRALPLPAVAALPAPGHTPGATVVVFTEAGQRAVMLGDIVHCPVQLIEDDWNTPFDVDPDLARRTRRDLVAEFAGDPSVLVAGAHFPGMRFGRLLRSGGRRRWVA